MKQTSLGLKLDNRRTRKKQFLDEMDAVVPWRSLIALIEPHCKRAATGRPPFALETLLRIHFLQQWFNLSDFAAEESLYDIAAYRAFVGLSDIDTVPDETSILRFRRLLEQQELSQKMFDTVNALLTERGLMLKTGTVVDATIIAAPSSTKNKSGERDPEMHQTKKGNQWHFGMKAHIGVDADSGLVHTVVGTAANEHDLNVAGQLLHGQEDSVHADAGYQGAAKREELKEVKADWFIAMRPGKRKALDKASPLGALDEQIEKAKASIRAKVEHPFRVIKQQFGYAKLRYRGLKKNTQRLLTMFALSNLWMARKELMRSAG
jgi:transposase, IS5 family